MMRVPLKRRSEEKAGPSAKDRPEGGRGEGGLLTPPFREGGVDKLRDREEVCDTMAKNYEIALIFSANLDDAAIDAEIEKVKGVVEQQGGTFKSVDKWGRRRLAYEIKKEPKGFYAFAKIEAEPGAIAGFESVLRLNENILRHMTVSEDD